MTISIPSIKAENTRMAILSLLAMETPKIRDVASIIGLLVSCELAVPYGPMYRHTIENEKNKMLAQNGGNFEAKMVLSEQATSDLHWWSKTLPSSTAPMHRHMPDYVIETDASKEGWGAHCDGRTTGGQWSRQEALHHINYLELKACLLALQSFFPSHGRIVIHLKSDNATTIAYLKHFGGSKSELLNKLSREIWTWCMSRNIWLTVSHLPGSENIVADYASRHFRDDLEWKLDPCVFQRLTQSFQMPDVDLFASRLNYQVSSYVSWQADPSCAHIDAFTIDWSAYECFYAFPPFSLIDRVLTKIEHDKAKGIVVAPLWHTQPWFPKMMKMLTRRPCILPAKPDLLSLPFSDRAHPLRDRLRLMACLLSGKHSENKEFLDKLPRLSLHPGERPPGNAIDQHYRSGFTSVVRQRLILFDQM